MVAARALTREELDILDSALWKSLKIIHDGEFSGDMQDGMLAHYLGQAGASDANVEARIEREPFDYRNVTATGAPITHVIGADGVLIPCPHGYTTRLRPR
jgi:hypothetical protein